MSAELFHPLAMTRENRITRSMNCARCGELVEWASADATRVLCSPECVRAGFPSSETMGAEAVGRMNIQEVSLL